MTDSPFIQVNYRDLHDFCIFTRRFPIHRPEVNAERASCLISFVVACYATLRHNSGEYEGVEGDGCTGGGNYIRGQFLVNHAMYFDQTFTCGSYDLFKFNMTFILSWHHLITSLIANLGFLELFSYLFRLRWFATLSSKIKCFLISWIWISG